jgi:hypothetical protein
MAGTYNLITEFSADTEADDVSSSPYWVLAVVRLAKPLSYSRNDKKSVSLDPTEGAKVRGGKTLIITDDCLQMSIQGAKESHIKSLSAMLIQTRLNYLTELLPGDWILAWIVHGKDKQQALVKKIKQGKACNGFNDGLKFVGRIESVRKRGVRDPGSGTKTSRYALQCYGFRELDTQIFYDQYLASNSVEAQNIGRWLAKIGLDIRDLFALEAEQLRDNVHLLIPAFMEIIVGRGVSKNINTNTGGESVLQAFTGGGPAASVDADKESKEAPFAYLVPKEVGDLLGKTSRDVSKSGGILAYADVVELLFGVQKYSSATPNDYRVFIPDIATGSPLTNGSHKFTGIEMMGAFIPNFPDFDNRPLWSLLQQYLNPVVNEMYTCLRVNDDGNVVPTLVLRQIPFTSTVLAQKLEQSGVANTAGNVKYTGFMDLPRWVLPPVLVHDYDIGRSDASRCNFVHVYGQSALEAVSVPITDQLVQNAPIRDDFDIQRSGLHTFMTTVAARAVNSVGTTPSVWMELIADHRIGSQFTLNGSVNCFGIQAPICEGDNLEFDRVVYHLESLVHSVQCEPAGGHRTWTTSMTLSNGLRADDSNSDTSEDFPIYPGFRSDDNTDLDPGATSDPDDTNEGEADSEKDTTEEDPFDPDSDVNK